MFFPAEPLSVPFSGRRGRAGLLCVAAIGGLAVAWTGPVNAQALPDAGTLQRETREALQQGTVAPPAIPAPAPSPSADGPRVLVQRVDVSGASLLTAADIAQVMAAFTGRELDMAGMRAAAQALSDAYRRKGWFARVSVPEQDLTGGVLHLAVAEGRFGKLVVDDQARRADADQVAGVVGSRLEAGRFYSLAALERGVFLANDLPGVSADGVLRAGDGAGTSDLALVIRDRPIIEGSVRIDNAGSPGTGRVREVAQVSLNNATGLADRLTMTGVNSDGMRYGEAGWTVAIGHDGLTAGISGSYLEYELGGTFAELGATGRAVTAKAQMRYPLVRGSGQSHWLRAEFDHADFNDDVLGLPAHRKQVDGVALVIEGTLTDRAGVTRYDLGLRAGGLDLSGMPEDAALDDITANREGGFARINLSLERTQRLSDQGFLRLAISSQWAPHNLDSSEQFSLGGPGAVRAYPAGEALGDRGALANVELHVPVRTGLKPGSRVFLFADGGVIERRAKTWTGWAEPGARNRYALFGAGAGLAAALPGGFEAQAVVAVPVGSNRGSADPALNQDGSGHNARGWLTLSKQF